MIELENSLFRFELPHAPDDPIGEVIPAPLGCIVDQTYRFGGLKEFLWRRPILGEYPRRPLLSCLSNIIALNKHTNIAKSIKAQSFVKGIATGEFVMANVELLL
jgi:hypothetical protein